MTAPASRMKFGMFMAPFHRADENPTLALQRDIELIQHMERLGYDEVWIGEHHSGSRELIADPALFIAAAAERTSTIKLGTGVTSLPYHHPFMVADQMNLLDHLTKGRAMLGIGPGVLASDAYMLGIEPTEQRRMMNESIDVIMRLLRGEVVTHHSDWFELNEAQLQLQPYSDPHLPVAVATSFTPSGPTAAGRHGLGLLSVAGADDKAFERTWGWVEEAAEEHGQTVDRSEWRVVLSFHLADTKEQALADLEARFALRAYVGDSRAPGAGLAFGPQGDNLEEAVANSPGLIVGTPDKRWRPCRRSSTAPAASAAYSRCTTSGRTPRRPSSRSSSGCGTSRRTSRAVTAARSSIATGSTRRSASSSDRQATPRCARSRMPAKTCPTISANAFDRRRSVAPSGNGVQPRRQRRASPRRRRAAITRRAISLSVV